MRKASRYANTLLILRFALDSILRLIQMHLDYHVDNIKELMFPKYLPGVVCPSRIKTGAGVPD